MLSVGRFSSLSASIDISSGLVAFLCFREYDLHIYNAIGREKVIIIFPEFIYFVVWSSYFPFLPPSNPDAPSAGRAWRSCVLVNQCTMGWRNLQLPRGTGMVGLEDQEMNRKSAGENARRSTACSYVPLTSIRSTRKVVISASSSRAAWNVAPAASPVVTGPWNGIIPGVDLEYSFGLVSLDTGSSIKLGKIGGKT